MVDILCTRCEKMGVNYPTVYVAKFSLVHKRGCGAKIGIPNYFISKKPTEKNTTVLEKIESKVKSEIKPKKRKTKKKSV